MVKTRSLIAAALAGTLVVGTAIAASDPAAERQQVMKNVGAATKMGAAIAKGEMPFDASTAQAIVAVMNSSALGFGYMFPEGSETGSETEAAPTIWSDREGFNAKVNDFIRDSTVEVTDLDGFKAFFGTVTKNCGACHETYRVKK